MFVARKLRTALLSLLGESRGFGGLGTPYPKPETLSLRPNPKPSLRSPPKSFVAGAQGSHQAPGLRVF